MIDLVSMMNNSQLEAKPIKIVAGLEPEKTNIFLQGVYQAAVSGDDSGPFVKKILQKYGGGKPEEPAPKEKP